MIAVLDASLAKRVGVWRNGHQWYVLVHRE